MERPAIDVKGRVVVITGAARGMGRAYTLGFLKEGARVVATDLSWNGAEDFQAELNASQDALTGDLDIRNQSQIEAIYKATLERFGTVDVLINNAGMRQRDLYPPSGAMTVLGSKLPDWERMFAVNVFGTVKMIQQFIQPMLEQRRGSIVSVSSTGSIINPAGEGAWTALRPHTREMPYMSSKSALLNLTLYLADEVKEFNIAANVVFPGHTRTTGTDEQEVARRALGARGPAPLEPEHMVPLVLYLAQQDAAGETGKAFDAVRWNEEHGHGGADQWRAPAP